MKYALCWSAYTAALKSESRFSGGSGERKVHPPPSAQVDKPNPPSGPPDGRSGSPRPPALPAALAGWHDGDPDFAREVLEHFFRYPPKREPAAYALWAFTGLFGGHRFYLGRTVTALAMLFTLGGALVWWWIDFFRVQKMVDAFNEDQEKRKKDGRPPRSLAFMPNLGEPLPARPPWAKKRSDRRGLAGDIIVLSLAGGLLGSSSATQGDYEPIVAVVVLVAITLLGARWQPLARLPVLRVLDRWVHRLRLFYYLNDPGGWLALAFRPYIALISLIRKRARAEGRLYMQLGGWFTILFLAVDIAEAARSASSVGTFFTSLIPSLTEAPMVFLAVYMLATPIGAILAKHLLLERSDRLVRVLGFLVLAATAAGLLGVIL